MATLIYPDAENIQLSYSESKYNNDSQSDIYYSLTWIVKENNKPIATFSHL
jgi:hypothetical protein